ncbi:ribbon-helix-helix domain-containing protein [Aequorivita sp. H23M31]|uniref:Ribbon-helix-helix domain-containing protein n=1 Tax=Aequorivita ciconiae TaxID=2494375 RepID=A0A410G6C4_9FLAO|nr:ribbon-helix-helix domain-containing protein [Aequorivita sp. H23M31]QAA82790.1 ribbon-helix-helix domain-containing protein [Aequorivita sp. H23M31]
MATFTSSLPDELLEQLAQEAKNLKIPKNKLLQKALEYYLERLEKAQYAKSFERISNDPEMQAIAEEGIEDWFKMLDEYDKE